MNKWMDGYANDTLEIGWSLKALAPHMRWEAPLQLLKKRACDARHWPTTSHNAYFRAGTKSPIREIAAVVVILNVGIHDVFLHIVLILGFLQDPFSPSSR